MTETACLTIGHLASLTGETVKTLRYWSDLGLLTCERRPSGYRQYLPDATGQARFVRSAQAAGFTLEEIRGVMAARADGRKPCELVKAELKAHLENVQAHITRLRQLEAQLQAKVRWANEHPDPECDSVGCVYLDAPGSA